MARFDTLGLQYFTDGRALLGGGLLNFYEPGTTPSPANRKTTYSNSAMTVANTNPVVIDAAGRAPNIFFSGVARCVLTDSAGVVIEDKDPVGDDVAAVNAFAVWAADRTYSLNQPVTGSDGYIYTSRVNNNLGNNPISSPTQWQLIAKTIGFDDANDGYVYTVDTSEDLKIAAVPKSTIRALVPISTVTASGVAAVDFTGIDNSYSHYIIEVVQARGATDGQNLLMRTSANAGSSYDSGASDYAYTVLVAQSGGTVSVVASTGDTELDISGAVSGNDDNQEFVNVTIRLANPSAADYGTLTWSGAQNAQTTKTYTTMQGVGQRVSAAAFNAVRLFFTSGNIAEGTFTLYGVRTS